MLSFHNDRTRWFRWVLGVAFLVLAVSAGSARGAMIFTDRAAFEAAASGLSSEGFNELYQGGNSIRDFGAFTLSVANGVYIVDFGPEYVSEGTGAVVLLDVTPFGRMFPLVATFTFDDPINSFGVDIKDWGSELLGLGGGTLTVSSNTGSINETIGSVPDYLPHGNLLFFGVIDDTPFTSLTFTSDRIDPFAIDHLVYGTTPLSSQAVPEPSSLALMGLGIGAFIMSRRRRAAA